MESLFLPGWGAPASLYAPMLPPQWTALEPPTFAASGGALSAYVRWLSAQLSARGAAVVGGHSMGAALGLLAAAVEPGRVARLVLVSPAGLPLSKPIHRSAADFGRQLLRGIYPPRDLASGIAALARAPRAAFRLAHEVRSLDLRRECVSVRRHGVPALVIGCRSDSLVRTENARLLARLLGADYVELDSPAGHMWMLTEPARFTELLAR